MNKKLVDFFHPSSFRLHPSECAGWALASLTACKAAAFELYRFKILPDALTARSSIGARTPAPQAGRMGSIPIRATWPSDGTGRHATLRTSSRNRRGSSTLPLVTFQESGVRNQESEKSTRLIADT